MVRAEAMSSRSAQSRVRSKNALKTARSSQAGNGTSVPRKGCARHRAQSGDTPSDVSAGMGDGGVQVVEQVTLVCEMLEGADATQ